MRTSQSQLPFVERAEKLASQLKGVERNVFLSIVADFLTDPRSEPARLTRMLNLLGNDSGDHLKRSGSFGVQARVVVQELPSILKDTGLSAGELRTILGWTSRLLQVRSAEGGGEHGAPRHAPGSRLPNRAPANQRRPTKPYRPPSRPASPPPAPAVSSVTEAPPWEARIRGLGWGNAGPIVAALLSEFKGDLRREAAKAIIERMGGKREFRAKRDKPWVQELFAAAEEQGG